MYRHRLVPFSLYFQLVSNTIKQHFGFPTDLGWIAIIICNFPTYLSKLISTQNPSERESVSQSCPTLCNPKGDTCNLPGSSVLGIPQVRILAWVTISFSRGFSEPRDWTRVSCIAGGFFTVWATRKSRLGCPFKKAMWEADTHRGKPAKWRWGRDRSEAPTSHGTPRTACNHWKLEEVQEGFFPGSLRGSMALPSLWL